MSAEIRIHGVRELTKAFKQIDREYGKQVQRGMKAIGQQLLARIQERVPGGAGGGLKVRSSQRGFGITFPAGEATGTYDFYPWLDFGGSVGKGHQVGVPWSGSVRRDLVKGGRYVYPTIADEREAIGEAVVDTLMDLAHRFEFETHG
jgi:hypothetical protein